MSIEFFVPITFNLHTISARSGIPTRKLRYCLDHDLLPARTWFVAEHEVGRQRRFDTISAVYLICAARLLIAGCKRDAVRRMLGTIELLPARGRNSLHLPRISNGITSDSAAVVDFADDTHARWRVGTDDSGWMRLGKKLVSDPGHNPKVAISLDIADARKTLIGK